MGPDDTVSMLASADFFEICNAEQQRLLAFASERQQYNIGEEIFHIGEPAEGAFVINKGTVTLATSASNPEQMYTVTGPGALIGEIGLILKRDHRNTATASTQVDCLFVPRVSFDKLVRQYPDMAQRAAQRIEARLGEFLGSLEPFKAQRNAE